jgi:hypothetical protein
VALQIEKIFLGNTPNDQRRWITGLLGHLGERYSRVEVPCCGQFSLAKCAIEAGFLPSQIHTSDASMFSSLLGALYSGAEIDSLPFSVGDEWAELYAKAGSEAEKAATLILVMKLCQLRPNHAYERQFWLEYRDNADAYIGKLADKLADRAEFYDGISYEIADLREHLDRPSDDDTIWLVNPPAFGGGYSKMFEFGQHLRWDIEIAEWDWKQEYEAAYERSHDRAALWYRYQTVEGFDSREVGYGRQYDEKRTDFWLFTRPEEMEGFKYAGTLTLLGDKEYRKAPYPTWGQDDELRPDARISFIPAKETVAMYYRDLWAHKMGSTRAEGYFLMMIDGKVFATVGFFYADLLSLRSTRVYETFGFSAPSRRYPNMNRLLMRCITCDGIREPLISQMSGVNRFYKLKGLRTTCISKYRKVKLNNGLMTIVKRERLPNGTYKMVYDTDFRAETLAEQPALYLAELGENDGAQEHE